MNIKTNNKEIYIPNWVLALGVLAIDNVVANVCKTASNRKLLKLTKEK